MTDNVIIVSKGHQPRGQGNTGAVGVDGLSEFGVVGAVGDLVIEYLFQAETRAVVAPRTGVMISRPGARSRFAFVADIMKQYPAACVAFVDIHCNAFGDGRVRGTETFASSPHSKSLPLASLVNANVVESFREYDLRWVDRGVKFNNFLIFSRTAAVVNGVKGADFALWFGLWGPAGMPARSRSRPLRHSLADTENRSLNAREKTLGLEKPQAMAISVTDSRGWSVSREAARSSLVRLRKSPTVSPTTPANTL